MGTLKDDRERAEHGKRVAAERDDRRCPYCSSVIPYGQDRGPHGECYACVGALKDDD